MLNTTDLQRLIKLIPAPPEESSFKGATSDDVAQLTRAMATIPVDLEEWLLFCNGSSVGPGGVFGVNTGKEYLDILYHLELYPQWKDKGWIPVAGDGCGNYYVLVASTGKSPVLFVETMEDPDEAVYIVASNLEKFLLFLFEKELKRTSWPFDKSEVAKLDPDILEFGEYDKPWE